MRGIVLNIDSPGGDANGIHELAEMIYQGRGQKPVIAYVGGDGASAAYWVATAADEVVVDATARLGSIGVVMTIKRTKDSEDVETLEIVSSQSPNKRLDPGSKEGREAYQSRLDELADVFIDRVARNMAVERDTVLEEFGRGGILIGQNAVNKGMATRLGSLEGVIAELKGGKKPMTKESKTNASGGDDQIALTLPGAEEMSASDVVAALTAQRPDVLEAIQGKPEESALSAAGLIAKACADAGIPALSASLLKDGVTRAEAEARIKAAGSLKDTLSAAGLSGSFETLVANLDDPVKLVGQAIHETKAASDESSDGSRVVVEGVEEKSAVLSAKSIYSKRQSKTK
ncbi:TPA: S49 family peptidase [Vibrio parahaemolyticus]